MFDYLIYDRIYNNFINGSISKEIYIIIEKELDAFANIKIKKDGSVICDNGIFINSISIEENIGDIINLNVSIFENLFYLINSDYH